MPKKRRGRKPASRTTRAAKSQKTDEQQIAVPEPPQDLGDYGRQYWKDHAEQLIKEGVLTPLHLSTFFVICKLWHEYRTLDDWIGDDPANWVFTTEKGYEQEIPQVRQRDKALDHVYKLWGKFGLTPHALATLQKLRGKQGSNATSNIKEFAKKKYAGDDE